MSLKSSCRSGNPLKQNHERCLIYRRFKMNKKTYLVFRPGNPFIYYQ